MSSFNDSPWSSQERSSRREDHGQHQGGAPDDDLEAINNDFHAATEHGTHRRSRVPRSPLLSEAEDQFLTVPRLNVPKRRRSKPATDPQQPEGSMRHPSSTIANLPDPIIRNSEYAGVLPAPQHRSMIAGSELSRHRADSPSAIGIVVTEPSGKQIHTETVDLQHDDTLREPPGNTVARRAFSEIDQSTGKLRDLNRSASGATPLALGYRQRLRNKKSHRGITTTPSQEAAASNMTHEPRIEDSTSDVLRLEPRRSIRSNERNRMVPEETPMPGLTLSVHELPVEPVGDMLSSMVVLETKFVTAEPKPAAGQKVYSIDAVAVIDNSIYSSPASIMAHCDAVYILASHMRPHDRLAVMTTHPMNHKNSARKSGVLVLQLGKVQIGSLDSGLRSIKLNFSNPRDNYLQTTIAGAKWLLESDTASQPNPLLNTAHVFVLTANVGAYNDGLTDALIQTHFICASTFPWRRWFTHEINGWAVLYTPSDTVCNNNPEGHVGEEFQTSLRRLIGHAQAGERISAHGDVTLKLKPQSKHQVVAEAGGTQGRRLHPGESCYVIKRIDVEKQAGPLSMLTRFPQGLRTASREQLDPEREISAVIDGRAHILKASLRYRNPSLYPGTICEYAKDVEITSPPSSAGFSEEDRMQQAHDDESKAFCQKYQIYHLAVHFHPARAMQRISQYLKPDEYPNDVVKYADLAMEELRHREIVVKKLGLRYDDDTYPTHRRSDSPQSFRSVLSEVAEDTNIAPGNFAYFQPRQSLRPDVAAGQRSSRRRVSDKAAQLWKKLGREKKSKIQGGGTQN